MAASKAAVAAPTPLHAALLELVELDMCVNECDATRTSPLDTAGLRAAITMQADKVAHEAARFGIVLKSCAGAGPPDERSLVQTLTDLTANATELVTAVQLFTQPARCGSTLAHDVRSAARSLIRSLIGAMRPLVDALAGARSQKAGSAASATAPAAAELWTPTAIRLLGVRHGDASVSRLGMVLRCADTLKALAPSNAGAVKRRLLSVGKLVKTSVEEVCAENDITDTVPVTLPVLPPSPAEPAASAAPQRPAGGSASTQTHAKGAAAKAAAVRSPTAEDASGVEDVPADVRVRVCEFGVVALRLCMRPIKAAITLVDTLNKTVGLTPTDPARAEASEAAPAHGVSGLTCVCALTAADALGAAASQLNDAVIDYAAALNELSEGELPDASASIKSALGALRAAVGGLPSVCVDAPAASDAAAAPPPLTPTYPAVLHDFLACVDAAVPYVDAAASVWVEYEAAAGARERE